MLALALGIGANTVIFSVMYAVLLRPLPVRDAGRLVQIAMDSRVRRKTVPHRHSPPWQHTATKRATAG